MKKKSNVIISLSVLLLVGPYMLIQSVGAAYPTAEGLFRNGDNKELVGDYVVTKLVIEEVHNEEVLKRIRVDESDEIVANILTRKKAAPRFLKLIMAVEKDTRIDLLQLEFSNKEMKKDSLIKSKLIKGYRRLIRSDEDIERAFFNSLLVMFLVNESKEVITILHKIGVKFPTNNMMMNLDKRKLLTEYKKYLIAIKEDESLKEELLSPVKPINEDEKEQADLLLKENMYRRVEGVDLIKRNNQFFWKVEFENFKAFFRNSKHRLDELTFSTEGKSFNVKCGEYVLYNGVHELPTKMLVKDSKERVYSVSMLSLSNFTNGGKRLYERARDYKKIEDANREKQAKVQDIQPEVPMTLIY